MSDIIKRRLLRLNKNILSIIRFVGQKAEQNGGQAYLVGGFVRDLILKKVNLDLDFVIEGEALRVAQNLARKNKAALTMYKKFKTATLTLPDGLRVDIATARRETYPCSGALPVVKSGSVRNDLYRRDFTVNAMAVAVNPPRFAQLVDYFGGLEDLKAKKIRVFHHQSFIDDPTRILRAVRFEQRFDFCIEQQTAEWLRDALRHDVVKNVTPPRYFAEFKKILGEPEPVKSIKRLDAFHGFGFIDSHFRLSRDMVRLLSRIGKTIPCFQKRFGFTKPLDLWLVYWMALVYRMSPTRIERISGLFHFRTQDKEKVLLNRKAATIIRRLSSRSMAASDIHKILKSLSYENIVFLWTLCTQSIVRKHIGDFLVKYDSVKLRIDGNDLKQMGIDSGRCMGLILEKILNEKIDGRIHSIRDELRLAKKLKHSIRE